MRALDAIRYPWASPAKLQWLREQIHGTYAPLFSRKGTKAGQKGVILLRVLPPVLPHIQVGKLRPLAVTTATRSAALPDVPTLDEAGLKGFAIGTWFGVLAPAATPPDILARLNAEMVKVIKSPEFRKRMDEIGAQPIGNSREEMARQIKDETEKFAALVKAAKVSIE